MENQEKKLETEQAILNEERAILKEERQILAEEKSMMRKFARGTRLLIAVIVIAAAAVGGLLYWKMASGRISIEKAEISAPAVQLAPAAPGVLEEVFVQEGDSVRANTPLVRVGNELVKAKNDGVVISLQTDTGKLFNRGEPVAAMIDPADLRVVGRIEEDKGLRDLRVGQLATFTVDAFGSRRYVGLVDEISPTSRDTSAVFAISDKRAVKEFAVKVRFNVSAYPELKNGMSAKILVLKD